MRHETRVLERLPEGAVPEAPPEGPGYELQPRDPRDRGGIDFECPSCNAVLVRGMAESFVARAGPVFCLRCHIWLSPRGAPQ